MSLAYNATNLTRENNTWETSCYFPVLNLHEDNGDDENGCNGHGIDKNVDSIKSDHRNNNDMIRRYCYDGRIDT